MKEVVKFRLPFSGFYPDEMSISRGLAKEIEEQLKELSDLLEIDVDELERRLDPWGAEYHHNWEDMQDKLAEDLCAEYAEQNDLPEIRFIMVWSPKFYNFANDQIDAEIDAEWFIQKVEEHKEGFRAWLVPRMASRDGFCPYYSNHLIDWPEDVLEWEVPQAELFMEYLDAEGVFEYDHGHIEDLVEDRWQGNCKYWNYVDPKLLDKFEEIRVAGELEEEDED